MTSTGYNPLLMRMKARLNKRNQNCLILVAGETGSGKSYAGMRVGQLLDPDFSIKNVVFTPGEFMDVIEKSFIKEGSCIVFDEAGVGIPSRDWYTIQNKMLGYVMQTFRHMNLAVIFTVPNIGFIDVQLRNLFHMYLETQSINYKKKKCNVRLFYFRQWPRSEKVQPIHPRYKIDSKYTGESMSARCIAWNLGMPEGRLIIDYENKKGKFSIDLRKDARKSIRVMKEKQEPKVSKTQQCIVLKAQGLKNADIAKELKMQPQNVTNALKSHGI